MEAHAGGPLKALSSYPWWIWMCLCRWLSRGEEIIPLLCSHISLARYSACQTCEHSTKANGVPRVLYVRDARDLERPAQRRVLQHNAEIGSEHCGMMREGTEGQCGKCGATISLPRRLAGPSRRFQNSSWSFLSKDRRHWKPGVAPSRRLFCSSQSGAGILFGSEKVKVGCLADLY